MLFSNDSVKNETQFQILQFVSQSIFVGQLTITPFIKAVQQEGCGVAEAISADHPPRRCRKLRCTCPQPWVAVVNADRGLAAIAAVEESGQEKTRCIVSNAEFQLNNAAPWGGGVVGQRHLPDRRIGQSRNAVAIGKVQRQRRFSQRAVVLIVRYTYPCRVVPM